MPGLWDIIQSTAPNANRVAQAMRPQAGQGVPVKPGTQLQMPAGTFDPLTGQTAGGTMGLGQAAAMNPNIAAAMGNTVGGLRPSMGATSPQPMMGNMGAGSMMAPQMGGMGQMDPNIAAMMRLRMAQLGGAGGAAQQGGMGGSMQPGPNDPNYVAFVNARAAMPGYADAVRARGEEMFGTPGVRGTPGTPLPTPLGFASASPPPGGFTGAAPAVLGERFGMGGPSMDAMAARNLAQRLQGGMGAPKMGGVSPYMMQQPKIGGASPYMGGAVARRSAAGPRY